MKTIDRTHLRLLAGILLLGSGTAVADISFDLIRWDNGLNLWTSQDGVGTVGQSGGGLGFSFDPADPWVFQTDIVAADRVAGFIGDYTQYIELAVSFDWYGYEQSVVSLYFESDFDVGSAWAYDLVAADGWNTYTVSFADDYNWSLISGSASFSDALTDVSLVGVQVGQFGSATGYGYVLDNWQYEQIPEPGSIALALTVLASSLAMRRKSANACPGNEDGA